MKQKYLIYLLLFPIAVFVFWIGFLAAVSKEGDKITLPVTGYDPRNLLSGHYIDYRIDWDKADCAQFDTGVCPRGVFDAAHRVYIPEDSASTLERLLNTEGYRFEVVYAYKKGNKPIVKELLINGENWHNTVR